MKGPNANWRAEDLRAQWGAVLRRLHADMRDALGLESHYEFDVVDIGPDGADLIVHAHFLKGHRYCCCDPVCKFLLGHSWQRVRRAMAEEYIDHLNPVRIREWRVTVEAGSVFHHGSEDGRWTTKAAFSYCVGPFCEPEEDWPDPCDSTASVWAHGDIAKAGFHGTG